MWVMGGGQSCCSNSAGHLPYHNDVWYSSNGVSWTQATSNANWSDRWGHKCLVFEDKIWVLGGQSDGETKNDVWYSTDGKNWTQVTSSADWSARKGFANTVYNNKIWIIGGSGWDSSSSRTFSPDAWFW